MAEEVPIIYTGYIKLNTSYIPSFLNIEKYNGGELECPVYIKSPIPIDLKIGGTKYVLEKGTHVIPNIIPYHSVKILTNISENENIEVYHKCLTDDVYYKSLISFISFSNERVLVSSIMDNKNDYALMVSGMAGPVSVNGLNKLKNEPFHLHINRSWSNKSKIIKQNDITKNTYSCLIYHQNMEIIQKDEDVTKLLVNYYNFFVCEKNDLPCILITYSELNYEELKEVLKNKYDITICKGKPNSLELKTYEEIVNDVIICNNSIKKYEELGIIEFVRLNEYQVTMDFYENDIIKQPKEIKINEFFDKQ